MTSEVVSCKAADDIKLAERMMARHHKSRMIVTDDGGKLVGVISLSDVVENDEPFRAARTAKEIAEREVRS
jgi:CBS-domain-containing membrane protein